MTTPTSTDPEVRALGRYQLVQALGQGGMGEVFLAKITGAAGFEKPCIVKTILPSLLSDRQFLDRFHHEAKVLVHLVHSNIAQVYDMGEADGVYFMALEYVAGVDLSQLMDELRRKEQQVPVPVALYLGSRIAEGLGYAHRKAAPDGTPLGIVHRDVSPHNVMAGYEGEVKVIDFGLARSAARSRYTLPATVMGKLGYMSPEQARAEPLDHRADIYACGLIVWELLAGRPAFSSGTVGEMMAAMGNPRLPSLCELRPDVDSALDEVVRNALAPNPDQRYPRADEFSRKLQEQLIRLGSAMGAEEVGEYVRTTCPEAFAAQRKLLSKLSTVTGMRRSPIPLSGLVAEGSAPSSAAAERPRPPVATFTGDAAGVSATYVHTASPVPAEAAASAKSAAGGSKAKGPLIALAAVLLVGAGAGASWFFTRQPAAPVERASNPPETAKAVEEAVPPSPAPAAVQPEAAKEEIAQAADAADAGGTAQLTAAAQPGGDSAEIPDAGSAPVQPAVAIADPAPAQVAPATSAGEQIAYLKPARVTALISDRSGNSARIGRSEGLKPGSVLQIVGLANSAGERRLFGTATVLEADSKRARLALDDQARKAAGARLFVVVPTR